MAGTKKDRLINKEQRRQIEIHKWIASEKAGRDLSKEAEIEWAEKYGASFRKWAESLPFECVGCGLCNKKDPSGFCERPFDPQRIKFIEARKKNHLFEDDLQP